MAGIRPANAPIRMAEAMPPDYASAGITTAQLFVLAYTAVAAAPANADAAADDGEQDRLGEELRPDLGLWHRGGDGGRSPSGVPATEMIMMLSTPTAPTISATTPALPGGSRS
jgi:hypothetical protein